LKPGFDGDSNEMKAKLVAREFEQQVGVEFGEPFAPIMKWKIVHSMGTLTSHIKRDIVHLNVKTAFLTKDLKEMHMFQVEEGFVLGQETKVCKL
jgi:hypothetical protein